MKKYLWIGNYEDVKKVAEMSKKGYKSSSSQVSQQNLIFGLEQTRDCTFDIISGSVLPPYPNYRQLFIHSYSWSHKHGANDTSVGYFNGKYINRISCQHSMEVEADKWADAHCSDGSEVIVIAYSMRSPIMSAACRIKQKIPSAKLFLIITDLPEFMDLAPSIVKKTLKRIDSLQQKKYMNAFDGFILYAEKMAQYLNIQEKPWLLMEGSLSAEECERAKNVQIKQNNHNIIIMYSGTISKKYGIPELLKAFRLIPNEDCQLWLTGSGDADVLVRDAAQKDPRIIHYGFLKSRQELLALQEKATMFVSMRMPTEKASNYCFPSKLFEYMITGKPVLSFRIGGIPKEYWKYLIEMKSPEPADICSAINQVLSMNDTERLNFGSTAKQFITHKKNNIAQSENIWHFIDANG
ncbi:glycosyltransferase [uncultured Ruminococcus sp.]|uniref:glycosyltransferase n=1 Tax=uncultured Ruminococcus sp. TaxID=165186 RepID=UPI0025ED9D70|nr:glycosyltransferase [uncultured Ruminococcus sp.]